MRQVFDMHWHVEPDDGSCFLYISVSFLSCVSKFQILLTYSNIVFSFLCRWVDFLTISLTFAKDLIHPNLEAETESEQIRPKKKNVHFQQILDVCQTSIEVISWMVFKTTARLEDSSLSSAHGYIKVNPL